MLTGVSKTAILTLRARADEHLRADRALEDPYAVEWLALSGWPGELDRWYAPEVQSFLAFRTAEIDAHVRDFVERTPRAIVVELGAGLSSRVLRLGVPDGGRWIDLDLPEVITLRESLGVARAGHTHLARSVLDLAWLDAISVAPEDAPRLMFVAEGLLYYLPRADVDALFRALRSRFAGATACFDVLGPVDWPSALERSSAVGTPMRWHVEPPFERTWPDFGLTVIPGREPDVLMHEAIDRYWPRFGAERHAMIKLLAQVPTLAGQRSGVVLGCLIP
ncbi:class I SAM-dependent methyltransferase [Myxococcota bacterium]|nr:class I SAM-dependent methyltransferase [Myxococcota bacterium]